MESILPGMPVSESASHLPSMEVPYEHIGKDRLKRFHQIVGILLILVPVD